MDATASGSGEYKVSSAYNNDNWSCGGFENDKVSLVWWWGRMRKASGRCCDRLGMAITGSVWRARALVGPQGGNTTNRTPVVPDEQSEWLHWTRAAAMGNRFGDGRAFDGLVAAGIVGAGEPDIGR